MQSHEILGLGVHEIVDVMNASLDSLFDRDFNWLGLGQAGLVRVQAKDLKLHELEPSEYAAWCKVSILGFSMAVFGAATAAEALSASEDLGLVQQRFVKFLSNDQP